MAYNNFGYPVNYQPMQMYQQPMAQQMQQPQQSTSGLIWVQGEGAAKSYLVAPNTTVALFDNESQTIYIKSADASGMPSIKVLDYTLRDSVPTRQISAQNDFATKEDVMLLKEEINALRAKLGDAEGSVTK